MDDKKTFLINLYFARFPQLAEKLVLPLPCPLVNFLVLAATVITFIYSLTCTGSVTQWRILLAATAVKNCRICFTTLVLDCP